MNLYCTYLTTYTGNKMPMFYIGSTTIKKIESGYHGSVSSKAYKKIWEKELKDNPTAFKTKIISTHNTRTDALEKENKLQVYVDAVYNTMYINKGYAYRTFGDQTSERMTRDNPMKKIKSNSGTYKKGCTARIKSMEERQKIRDSQKGKNNSNFGAVGSFNHINDHKAKCPYCDVHTTSGNLARWHNDNCKSKDKSTHSIYRNAYTD